MLANQTVPVDVTVASLVPLCQFEFTCAEQTNSRLYLSARIDADVQPVGPFHWPRQYASLIALSDPNELTIRITVDSSRGWPLIGANKLRTCLLSWARQCRPVDWKRTRPVSRDKLILTIQTTNGFMIKIGHCCTQLTVKSWRLIGTSREVINSICQERLNLNSN